MMLYDILKGIKHFFNVFPMLFRNGGHNTKSLEHFHDNAQNNAQLTIQFYQLKRCLPRFEEHLIFNQIRLRNG